jgi:hypothetical protein
MNSTATIDDIRAELVARIRLEIQAGLYDTPEKLEWALDRMMDGFARD